MSRRLANWLDAFMEFTNNSEPHELFRKWTGVSTMAAALQRKCYLEWGTLTFYPNMYVVLVAPPGKRKGTAMAPGSSLLRDLGVKLSAEAITREALIRELRNSNNTAIEPETGKMELHSSLTVFSEELTVFLGYNNYQLMSDLSNWYDCPKVWTYRTKTQGTDNIIGVFLNMLGATTPQLLHSTLPLDAIGGGLTTRIIFVYSEKKGKIVPLPFLTKSEKELWESLRLDLEKIHMMAGSFKFTEGMLDRWVDWYTEQDENPPFKDEKLGGYLERRPAHAMKLSIVMSASRNDSMILTTDDLNRSIELLEKTEVNMPKVFSGVGRSPIAVILPKVMAYIATRKEVTLAELLQTFSADVDRFILEDKVIRTLEASNFVTVKHTTLGTIITYTKQERADEN